MNQHRTRWAWLGSALFLAGLTAGVGVGYLAFHQKPSPAPVAGGAAAAPAELAMNAEAAGVAAARERRALEGRARLEERAQAFAQQMTPEQRARMEELRERVRQNTADWQNLSREERQQRIASLATNDLGLTPEALERWQSRISPEQMEQFRQRAQGMRNRNNTRPPR